jgi:hypothetical protein
MFFFVVINFKSSDPRAASLVGGIRRLYFDAKIVSILGGKGRRGTFKKRIITL